MRKCFWCGKETKNAKFCSAKCSGHFGGSFTKIKDKSKICKNCNKDFIYKDYRQNFCSRSCSALFYNNERHSKNIQISNCMTCNKEISFTKNNIKKFCSKECSFQFQRNKTIKSWENNPSSATTTQGLSGRIRLHLIELAQNKCSLCGWSKINETTGRCPLEIDHVDGDCYNNDPSNLRVLCPNCHSLTPTYKALNKNSKRKR